MTAHYARLHDTTVRRAVGSRPQGRHPRQHSHIDPDGPLADAAWMKQHLARATQALPNGYCGLPLQQIVPARQRVRCALLRPDPAQRPRLEEIRSNLKDRIIEAELHGWRGEAEGLQVSLAGVTDKLAQIDTRTRRAVDLGTPSLPTNS